MNIFDIIEQRRSVRTFDGRELKEEHLQGIIDFAEKVENPYDLPITYKVLNAEEHGLNSPVIVGTNTFIAGKMRKTEHAEEAFGYSFEKVVLHAQSIGLRTTWIAGTMNRPAFEKAMALGQDEVMPCVSPLGYEAEKMSAREVLMRKGVKAASRIDFGELFFDGSFDKPLTKEKAGKLGKVLEAVRVGPSAVNKQPWRAVVCEGKVHFYEKHTGNRFVSADSWDLQKVDMGIALCHFEVAAKELGMALSFEINNPNIAIDDDMEYIASFDIA